MTKNVRFAFILANQSKKIICTERGDRVNFIINFIFGVLSIVVLFSLVLNYSLFNNIIMMFGQVNEFLKFTLYLLFGIALWFILHFLKALTYFFALQLRVIDIKDMTIVDETSASIADIE